MVQEDQKTGDRIQIAPVAPTTGEIHRIYADWRRFLALKEGG